MEIRSGQDGRTEFSFDFCDSEDVAFLKRVGEDPGLSVISGVFTFMREKEEYTNFLIILSKYGNTI